MNKTLLGLALALGCVGSAGAVTFFEAKTEKAGTLADVIGVESWTTDSLVVIGPVNSDDFVTMWNCAFYGRTTIFNLEKAQLEGNEIPNHAFFNGEIQNVPNKKKYLNLKRVILPEGITAIGYDAFLMSRLQEVNLPESLTSIGVGAFAECWLKKVVIPEVIPEISDYCFKRCSKMTSVTLPKGVKKIGKEAFELFAGSEVELPEGLEEIGEGAFSYAEFTQISLPNSVTKMGKNVFMGCMELTEVKWSDGLEELPEGAFWLGGFETLEVPGTIKVLGYESLGHCMNLREVTFGEGARIFEMGVLWNCDKLESVVLPSTTEKLDQNMFGGCPLKMLVCKAQVPPVADFYTFSVRAGFDFPVYVPVGSAELYSKAEGWNRFTNFIETNDFPTAGAEAAFAAGGTKVTGAGGMAVIETAGATAYEIYATDGRVAAAGVADGGRTEVALPQGVYVVASGGQKVKVAVK